MGHTVVLGFDNPSLERIHNLTAPFGANKIPFGRNCNREEANNEMDYHMTLYHWAKSMDEYCLSKIKGFHSTICQVQVLGTGIIAAEENSWLLYFDIVPTETFIQLKNAFEEHTGFTVSGFYHITIAVSKEYNEILKMNDYINNNLNFSFLLTADRLDLYHIWTPTRKTMSF